MRGPRRRTLLAGLVALATAAGAASAFGAAEVITPSPICCTFSKATFTMDQGEVATYENAGASEPHNVTATGRGPDGDTLFSSETITSGQTPVKGTQYLTSGTYDFVCTIHPGMVANLAVSGNGSPVPRPGVTLKVVSRKLEKVVASRRLKVKVTAVGQSEDVSLSARKGARSLGSATIDLAAGASRTVKLVVPKSAKKALKGLESAQVKVAAEVPFGESAAAKRKLR